MRGFPLGGKELWDLRVAGKRPEDMVVVSLRGPVVVPNPMLWVGDSIPESAIRTLEWRMLAGLDVEVWAGGETPLPRLLAALRAILPHAADVFVYYPDAGLRVAVRWLSTVVRVVDFDSDDPTPEARALGRVIAGKLQAELNS